MAKRSEEILKQMASFNEVLAVAQAYGTPDFASQLGMESLLAEGAKLQSDLKSAQMMEATTAVEIAIDGDPVRNHAVSISFLGLLLVKLQNLTNAVAQVQANAQTARGSIPNNLIASNRFELATIFPSSFGVGLRLPTEDQGKLFESDVVSSADIVCNLLSGQDLEQETIDMLSYSRVRGHYASLIDLVGKQGASVVFRTQRQPNGSTITAQQARDRATWLDMLKVTNETLRVEGELVGGSIETKNFQIKVESGEILRGSIVESAVSKMTGVNLGARVSAILEVMTATHEEAELESRTSYLLLDVSREV